MGEDDYSVSTRCVVGEYITYKIQRAGYTWQVSPTRNCPNNQVISTIKKLCEEFEKRYESQFSEMCAGCVIVDLNYENYMGVLEEITLDGLNWGRIIALFCFAGAMSVCCMKKGQNDKVDWIKEWTCQFVDHKVENWINENNGWKGLVDFYKNGAPKQDKANNWGSVILGGALGAFALGALIINRA